MKPVYIDDPDDPDGLGASPDVPEPGVRRRPGRVRRSWLRIVAPLAALASFGALPPVREAASAPESGKATAVPARGAAIEGAFGGLTKEAARLAGRADPIPVASLRELRFAPDAPPTAAEGGAWVRVTLRGDETIRGAFAAGSEEGIEVKPPDFPLVKIPFESVLRIESDAAYTGPCDEPARGRPPRTGTDVAYSKSGDSFPGTLLSANADGVVMEGTGGRKTSVSWADLVVVHLDEPALPPAEGLVAEVDTAGGSRLAATAVWGDASRLTVQTRTGLALEVPTSSVRVVRWTGGSFVYACELPFEAERAPYYADDPPQVKELSEIWFAARADRRRNGCPLRVGGVGFRHGIAVTPKSVVRVPLRKAFSSFDARFGIDDDGLDLGDGPGLRGNVTARVLADGKEVWSSRGSVRGGEPPRAVGPIDVTDVDVLTLEVDVGADFFLKDRADWLDPLLVRKP